MDAIQARDLDTVVSRTDDGTTFQHAEQAARLDLEALAAAMDALHDSVGGVDLTRAGPRAADPSTDPSWARDLVGELTDRAEA